MKKQPRRGLLGSKPMGPEFMQEINRKAKRMEQVTKIKESNQLTIHYTPAIKP